MACTGECPVQMEPNSLFIDWMEASVEKISV